MSNDNNSSDPFDFEFDSLNADEPQGRSADAFDLNDPFGGDMAPPRETGVSADNPYLNDSSVILPPGERSFIDSAIESAQEDKTDKKKGLLSGVMGGKKGKTPKEKPQKAPKEKTAAGESAPRDLGSVLCIAFSVFLFASLVVFNLATLLLGGGSLMGTLCFLGAFNIVGLALVAVPILLYKYPQERTLSNVLLGISVGAVFSGVLFLVNNFYQYYGFAISP